MSNQGYEPFVRFLNFLGNLPPSAQVASALVRGPLMDFGARAAVIMQLHESQELAMVSHYGHSESEYSRFSQIPLVMNLPIVTAFRECQVSRLNSADVPTKVPQFQVDVDLWRSMLERMDVAELVGVPILHQGAAIGAYGFMRAHGTPPVTADADSYLSAVAAALGLWMANPDSHIELQLAAGGSGQERPIHLSARQVEILLLAETGKSNESTSRLLGFSLSTVKKDLADIHRVFKTTDKLAAAARARQLGLLPPNPHSHHAA